MMDDDDEQDVIIQWLNYIMLSFRFNILNMWFTKRTLLKYTSVRMINFITQIFFQQNLRDVQRNNMDKLFFCKDFQIFN